MLSGINLRSLSEIDESWEHAQKHPNMWLMKRQQELEIFRRRWSDFPKQQSRGRFNELADSYLTVIIPASIFGPRIPTFGQFAAFPFRTRVRLLLRGHAGLSLGGRASPARHCRESM
jgi:hypothetical protein